MKKKKEKTAIRERRFRLVLWYSEEGFEKRKKELCELAEFSVSFALNSIPVAKIVPLLGVWINTKKEKYTDLDIVFEGARKRVPVIVTAQLVHSFASDKDKVDLDNWSEKYMPKGKPDYFGIYKSEPAEIFKGYLQPPTTEVTAVNAGITLSIVHWLSDLADVSMYSTACQLGTPVELALQAYNSLNRAKDGKWTTVKEIKIKEDIGDVWDKGIKVLFEDILEQSQNDKNNKHLYVDKKRKRIKKALSNIVPDKTLKLENLPSKDSIDLERAIARFLSREDIGQFAGISAWNRLVGTYSPAFLFSVRPTPSTARLIPTPCTIDKEKAKEITSSEIIQVRSSPVPMNRLARLICVSPAPTDPTGSVSGDPRYYEVGHYPFDKDMPDRVGDVQTIIWPEWMSYSSPAHIMTIPKQIDFMGTPNQADAAAKNNVKKHNAEENLKYLGANYARYAYLVSAYNTTSAVIITPLRVDIGPGDMIKYHTKVFGDDDIIMYGTVVSTEFHLSAGSNPCTTTLVLTYIRDSQTIDDPIENPKGGIGFYKEQFVGT